MSDPMLGRRRAKVRLADAVRLAGAAPLVVALVGLPTASHAQGGLPAGCAALEGREADCHLAVASVRAIQERVGTALWGGNPVPGTASTLGMRLGSTPRFSLATRLVYVPVDLPPLLDPTRDRSSRIGVTGLSVQGTVGVLQGWSPLPTVGGVFSVDAVGRLSAAPLPRGHGFQGSARGWSLGARVGLLRESFTLPGVSLTTTYGRSNTVAFGDPEVHQDGFARGAISDLNATLAASQRISAVRLTGGVASDWYRSRALIGVPDESIRGSVNTTRRSWFLNASWTTLIFHGSGELGWQRIPDPDGLPDGVRVDPVGWWAGVAFRMSL